MPHVRLLLGPAGSGKTHRCLEEIHAELSARPEGPPLLLLAPKQATFQLERQLLQSPSLPGYTRLQILSFDRLARFMVAEHATGPQSVLDEEGRTMVLRAILAQSTPHLYEFHASARLPGFARHLGQVLHECRQARLTPRHLEALSLRNTLEPRLRAKLADLANLLAAYLGWLEARQLTDADDLLDQAARILARPKTARPPFHLASLWMDGFAECTESELQLLTALIPHTQSCLLTFCLDAPVDAELRWISPWSLASSHFQRCCQKIQALPATTMEVLHLERIRRMSRFAPNPWLQQLEARWTGAPTPGLSPASAAPDVTAQTPRWVECRSVLEEATVAARAIRAFVMSGGRYRDCAVITRHLDRYHDAVQTTFRDYDIPCFLDQREPIGHHPLAELTRSALHGVAYGWRQQDWFAGLKSGLANADDEEIDLWEHEAVQRGWEGYAWSQPISRDLPEATRQSLESLRQRVWPPFHQLDANLRSKTDPDEPLEARHPTARQLADALREFWRALRVESQMEQWLRDSAIPKADRERSTHRTVWQQMHSWLDNLEIAFGLTSLPLREWLPILEAGLANLTIGVIPPALDQVLVGSIDRSRHPEVRYAIVLGFNDGSFPAPPPSPPLLTHQERDALATLNIQLTHTQRSFLGRERYYAYIALTRPSEYLLVTWSKNDMNGRALAPSPFVRLCLEALPPCKIETPSGALNWSDCCHPIELIHPLLSQPAARESLRAGEVTLDASAQAALQNWQRRIANLMSRPGPATLSAAAAHQLYGRVLRTSVTALEQAAACAFRYFVQAGLRAKPRRPLDSDPQRLGELQHLVLRRFHEAVQASGRTWHHLSPDDARENTLRLVNEALPQFGHGLFLRHQRSRLLIQTVAHELADFTATLVAWMQHYAFEPVAAELRFDHEALIPPWRIELHPDESLALELAGTIDRVDVLPATPDRIGAVIVIDYKSQAQRFETPRFECGLQLQLPVYLNVLRRLKPGSLPWNSQALHPAGFFYVGLRSQASATLRRDEALEETDADRRKTHQHRGRFDATLLPFLDQRTAQTPPALTGDQFQFSLSAKSGLPDGRSRDSLNPKALLAVLDQAEGIVRHLAAAVLHGEVSLNPYRDGTQTACDHCEFHAICRIDPWIQTYRRLAPLPSFPPTNSPGWCSMSESATNHRNE